MVFARVTDSNSDRLQEGYKVRRLMVDMQLGILDRPMRLTLAIVEPDRRHAKCTRGNEVSRTVVEQRRAARCHGAALEQAVIGVRPGLGNEVHGARIDNVAEEI